MAASFPTSVKTFATKVDGAGGDLVAAADVNDLQLEVAAIETELKKTTASVVDHGGLAGLADNDHPQYSLTTHDHDADYLGIAAADDYSLVDGWAPVADSWTYASATTITVPSGAASIYSVGDKFKLTANSVVLQGYIVGVADTLLTVAGNALTSHVFSAIYYSKAASPLGFPQWFNWIPSVVYDGGTTDPTSRELYIAKFSIIGRTAFAQIMDSITVGSGNRNIVDYSLPFVNANEGIATSFHTLNNSTRTFAPAQLLNGVATLRVYLNTAMSATGFVWANATSPI